VGEIGAAVESVTRMLESGSLGPRFAMRSKCSGAA
jgi:hypothetical protein